MTGGLVWTRSSGATAPRTVLFYGQSNMNNMVANGTGSPPAAAAGTTYFDDINLVWGAVPAADGLRNVLNALTVASGVPWRGINGSINGTTVEFLADDTPTGGLGLFATKLALAGVSTADIMLWMQGEGNAGEATQERDYIASLDLMHSRSATLMGKTTTTLPLVVAGLTTYGGAADGVNSDTSWWTTRKALFESTSQTGVRFSHSNLDGARLPADVFHLDAAAVARMGARYAQTALAALGYGGTEAHWEASGGATIDATHTNISLGLIGTATDFTPTSGITGFEVTGNNGATWVAATGARSNATTIQLTHASLSTTNARTVRYQFGMLPDVSAPVKDNSSLALPLTFTRDNITPTPLSTIARPDYWGNAYDNGQTGTTQANSGIPIGPAAARRLVICGIALGAAVAVSSATITPNIGTAKSATLIDNGSGVALGYALLDADADTATSITLSVTYASAPFSRTQMDVWAIPSAQLSSTTPSATLAPVTNTGTTVTGNIATPNQGIVIAYAFSSATPSFANIGVMSGTEAYAARDPQITFKLTVAADACNTASNASSAVTATFGASGNTALVAAAWL